MRTARTQAEDAYAETGGTCVTSQACRPPCRRESCRYHLASGAGWRRRSTVAVAEAADTCVLRLSEGRRTLEEVATLFGCTRERVRQIEVAALRKLAKVMKGRV